MILRAVTSYDSTSLFALPRTPECLINFILPNQHVGNFLHNSLRTFCVCVCVCAHVWQVTGGAVCACVCGGKLLMFGILRIPKSVALAYSKLCATFCSAKVIIIKAILFGQAKTFTCVWQAVAKNIVNCI